MRASTGAFRLLWSQPMRIFNVTGTSTASTVAARILPASTSSRISAEPAAWPTATFFTGQPKLMSIRSAPLATAIRAASAMASGSQPANCTEDGPPPATTSAMRMVLRFSRTMAQEAIISETTSPAPSDFARARNGRSVTPESGARITGVSSVTARGPVPRVIGLIKEGGTLLMIWANYRPGAAGAITCWTFLWHG